VEKGDRVAYCVSTSNVGAYAEHHVIPASKALIIPTGLTLEQGAGALLQGMTAHSLLKDAYSVKKGDTILVHAASGGMGLWLCQLGRILGATVIGTTSSPSKAALATKAGANHVLDYTTEDFKEEVMRITKGQGVSAVFDGVGKATFLKGLDCLKTRGHMVLYGAASGQPDPISPALLGAKGSLFLTRPSLFHYVANEEEYKWRGREVFEWVRTGQLALHITTFPLREAQRAHEALTGRKTTGKVLLLPSLLGE